MDATEEEELRGLEEKEVAEKEEVEEEAWLYPRMIPRLSRAGFNVLAGSAPESRGRQAGRQPSSHQTSLQTRTPVYVHVHARKRAHNREYTRARDTYLCSTELHVRARARALLHSPAFFRSRVREGGGVYERDTRLCAYTRALARGARARPRKRWPRGLFTREFALRELSVGTVTFATRPFRSLLVRASRAPLVALFSSCRA